MTVPQQWFLWWWWQMQLFFIKTCSPVQLLFDLSITVTVLFFLSVLTQRLCNGWQCWRQRQQVIISFQGGAAAPDAKVARRKMTGLSNKVRLHHHLHLAMTSSSSSLSSLSPSWWVQHQCIYFVGIRRVGCGRLWRGGSEGNGRPLEQDWGIWFLLMSSTPIILTSHTFWNAFRCEVKARFLCHFYPSTQTTAPPGTK